MTFERMYADETTSEPINEDELRHMLADAYKYVDLSIEFMKSHPGEWVIRTPFALYRYVEKENPNV